MKKLLFIGFLLGCIAPVAAMEEEDEKCPRLANGLLRLAITNNFRDSFQVALRTGADVNTTCEFTLNKGANNEIKVSDWTPLHYAAHQGDTELTKLFLYNGANVDAVDSLGKKPIDYCNPNKKLAKFISGESKEKASLKTIRSSTEVFELLKNATDKAD